MQIFMRSIRFFLIFYPVILLLIVTFSPNSRGLLAYLEETAMLAVSTVVSELLARGKSVTKASLLSYVVGIFLSTVLVWIVVTLALASIAYRASVGEIVLDCTLVFLIGVAPVLALLRKRELR